MPLIVMLRERLKYDLMLRERLKYALTYHEVNALTYHEVKMIVMQRLIKMDGEKTSMVIMTTDFRAGSSA
jgi:ribosomal protein S4E